MLVAFCTIEKPDHISGVDSWMKRIILALRETGIESLIITLAVGKGNFVLQNFAKKNSIPIELMPYDKYPYAENKVKKIISLVKKWKPDIFIPNYFHSAFYAIPYIRKFNIKSILVLHSDDNLYRAYIDEFVKKDSKYNVDGVVAVSELLTSYFAHAKKSILSTMIPYGVTIPKKTKSNFSNRLLKFVYVGRLADEQKRITDLTRSICEASEKFNNVEFYLYGSGPQEKKVRDLTKDYHNIHLMGVVDSEKIQEEVIKYDFFFLMSDYEGLPVALLEAMSCGLVPICLRIDSGIGQVIEHKKNGFIIENRTDDFFQTIEYINTNIDSIEEMSRNAALTIDREYSIKKAAEQWKVFFNKVIEKETDHAKIAERRKITLPTKNPQMIWENKYRKEVHALRRLKSYIYRKLVKSNS